jgi:hypothetical protein
LAVLIDDSSGGSFGFLEPALAGEWISSRTPELVQMLFQISLTKVTCGGKCCSDRRLNVSSDL